MKVVFSDLGVFSLSEKAKTWLKEHGLTPFEISRFNNSMSFYGSGHEIMSLRTHPTLVKCVEELGDEASSFWGSLKIKDVGNEPFFILVTDMIGCETVVTKETFPWVTRQICVDNIARQNKMVYGWTHDGHIPIEVTNEEWANLSK